MRTRFSARLRRHGPTLVRLAAGVVFLGVLVWSLRLLTMHGSMPRHGYDGLGYAELGEVLIHRIATQSPSGRMPLSSIVAAFLFNHLDVSSTVWGAFCMFCEGFLVYSLGCLLIPMGSLLAPLSLLLLAPVWHNNLPFWSYQDGTFSVLVLMVACLLVWRAQAPSHWRSFLLALSIGATFLFRSPLAFFPPLLVAFEWFRFHRRSFRPYAGHAAIVCLVPYLLVVPWIGMNWALHRRFIPFENRAPNGNIVLGALGMVQSVEGNWEALIDESSAPYRRDDTLAWALREIAGHPVRYAKAVGARVLFAVSASPLPTVMALLALWLYRRRREFQSLGLLLFYFVGIHCLMAVRLRYFEPLWPIISVLAASLIGRLWNQPKAQGEWVEFRFSAHAVKGSLAVVMALCLYVCWTVISYARTVEHDHAGSGMVFDAALASHPRDAWLLFQRGELRLARNEIPGAIADLSEAATLLPENPRLGLRLAWARMLDGDPAPLLGWKSRPGGNELDFEAHVLKAHGCLRLGRTERAREHLGRALERYSAMSFADELRSPRKERILSRMRSDDRRFAAEAYSMLRHRPPGERIVLLDELSKLFSWMGSSQRAQVERAELLLELGRRGEALVALERGEGMDPGKLESMRMIVLYRSLEEPRRALRVADSLAARHPKDGALQIERAELLLESGRKGEVPEALRLAESLDPSTGDLRRIARVYQGLGQCHHALSIWKGLIRGPQPLAKDYSDKAVCEYFSGNWDAAVSDLEKAIELSPGALEAQLSLGMAYAGQGLYSEALEVYERALALKPDPGMSSLRRQIVSARDNLRKRRAGESP